MWAFRYTGLLRECAITSSICCVLMYPWMAAVVDSTITTSDSLDYLVKFGYLAEQDSHSGALRTEESFSQALKQFQKMAGIEVTGKFDNATQIMMEAPRCGNKDNVQLGVGARRRRYALQGSIWAKQDLTYKISDFPKGISSDLVQKEVYDAFKVWSDVSPLQFTMRPYNERADITVRFARRNHGDGNPFDGRGRTLAHAFFPQFGGDVHFDDDEDWTINISSGVNMLQVAAHELGHSLGLSHSDVSTAIMAPFYRGYNKHFRLDKDDVSAIQELYGPRRVVQKGPTTKPSSKGPVLSIPKICLNPRIDGITMNSDGHTYIFKGTQYYRLNSYGIDEGYPKTIEHDWKGITGPIDSALHWDNGYTYIFKGHHYWKFLNFSLIYVRTISEGFKGIPDNIDASFVWGGNGKTYFFKGDLYWRYSMNHVDPGYPKPMSVWAGLPSNIDGALKWKNGRTYFFSGELYYRYNDVDFNTDASYPRNIGTWWLGCPDKDQISKILGNHPDNDTESNETDQPISQPPNGKQKGLSRDQINTESDAGNEQFLPVVDGGEAGTMDFLQEDENGAITLSFSYTMAVIFTTCIISVTFIYLHGS